MIEELRRYHLEEYNRIPDITVRAPGRINLIGEHTDYNLGFVFPAAIDKCIYFSFSKNESNIVRICSKDMYDSMHIDLKKIKKSEKNWLNYLLGVLATLNQRGCDIKGFDCVIMGDIPIGAGVSSSAALETGFVFGINTLFRLDIDKMDLARICQQADNEFLGVKSGLLDQFASLFGKKDKAILMDCRDQSYSYYSMVMQNEMLLLINTKVKHTHVDGEYNNRPIECLRALEIIQSHYPRIQSIRDVNFEILNKVKVFLGEVLYKRIHFVLEENNRVREFSSALKQYAPQKLGQLLYESHDGLKTLYNVSCEELDFLVDEISTKAGVYGSRMMGGGFGGCTLNLIDKAALTSIKDEIRVAYKDKFGFEPEFYPVIIEEGVSLI